MVEDPQDVENLEELEQNFGVTNVYRMNTYVLPAKYDPKVMQYDDVASLMHE